LVGGHAVALHGHPRNTIDLDLWICPDEENALAVKAACERVDLFLTVLAFESIKNPGHVIRLGVEPVKVDLITSLPQLDFDTCWSRRRVMLVDGIEIPVIDLASLRQTKRASGRFQDLADLENLPEAE